MKYINTIILIFLSLISYSQVAIIQDSDGYTNVRTEPDVKSKILIKVYDNYVFWYDIEAYVEKKDWIYVMIPKNEFSLGEGFPETKDGYIHRSRIKPLKDMELYTGQDFKFNYTLKPFTKEKRIFDYDKEQGKWITAINGRHAWGIDGYLPKVEVADVNVRIGNQQIVINKVLYQDIFECNNGFYVYKKDDLFFVYQLNSDGAGGYELVWVISKDGVVQRLVGSMI